MFCFYGLWIKSSVFSNVPFAYPLKTSENHKFSDVFREYRKRALGSNGLAESLVLMAFSINTHFFNLRSKYILFFINNNKGNLNCCQRFAVIYFTFPFANEVLCCLGEWGGESGGGACPQEKKFMCFFFKKKLLPFLSYLKTKFLGLNSLPVFSMKKAQSRLTFKENCYRSRGKDGEETMWTNVSWILYIHVKIK